MKYGWDDIKDNTDLKMFTLGYFSNAPEESLETDKWAEFDVLTAVKAWSGARYELHYGRLYVHFRQATLEEIAKYVTQ